MECGTRRPSFEAMPPPELPAGTKRRRLAASPDAEEFQIFQVPPATAEECQGSPENGAAVPFGEDPDNSPDADKPWGTGSCLPPPPPESPFQEPMPSPASPPPTPASEQFLIREGSHRDAFLKFFKSGETFASTYSVGRKIGEGGFGKVFMARHRVLGLARAVKRLNKSVGRKESRKNELDALMALDHPHIVRLVEYYDEEVYLYLVFELCEGPDLFDRIVKAPSGRLEEYDASCALRHMLKALQCCHAQYRGHFDIKPENFMYSDMSYANLKMIDLGMSSGFDLHRRRHKIKGTAAYMAPEFWRGIYGPEGDVWSCGVVLFVMLTGEPLLPNLSPATMKCEAKVRSLLRRRLTYAATTFNLSPLAQDLLEAMLQYDRHGRVTIREALNHSFNSRAYDIERQNQDRTGDTSKGEAVRILERLPAALREVAREPMLKRVARLAMAHVGEVPALESLAFRMLDWYGYGEISLSVLEKDFQSRRQEVPEDLDQVFEAIDINRDGYVSYLTFLSATLPPAMRKCESLCKVVFGIFDRNKDGAVDADDLTGVFGEEEVCQRIVSEVSYEGTISFQDFKNLLASAV